MNTHHKITIWLVVAGLLVVAIVFLNAPALLKNAPDSSQQAKGPSDRMLKIVGEEVNIATTQCMNKRLKGELRNFVESAQCANPVLLKAYRESGYPHMDLIEKIADKRIEVSKKMDAGALTETQGKAEIDQFVKEMADIERQRNTR
jgi:hypothetical protein